MNKKFLEELKNKLKKGKILLEQELSTFAKKDTRPEGDWDTKFPDLGSETSEDALEDKAKEIEEYERLLPVEFALEKRLKNINQALEKIKKGNYGFCEKCGQKISKERLLAAPEAKLCQKCQ